MSVNWAVAGVWNASLENPKKRPVEKRSHLWASELGRAPVDVFLHMNGEEPSNPPNARSLRKFEAGHMFEWIVGTIFKRAGIMLDEQVHCQNMIASPHLKYPQQVTGRADFIVGGSYDFEKAAEELEQLGLPEFFVRVARDMQGQFDKHYKGQPLMEKPVEVKSVGAYMFESILKSKNGSKHHRMQLVHYLQSLGYGEGLLVYICRDDMRLVEFPVFAGGNDLEEYRETVILHGKNYQEGVMPEKEQPIIFDEDLGKFTTNWRVAYSNYLTEVYGIKDQAEFDAAYKSIPARWNRVLNRFKNGDKMTPKNLEAMKEIAEAGFDLPGIASSFAGTVEEVEE